MLNCEGIERLVELSLISGYIKDGTAPLSLMLISAPESAKTSIIQSFSCPHTLETTDLSPKPIVDVVIPKMKNNELHHIIIPDLIKVLTHKEQTVQSTITFLNAMMEEGIKQNLFFGQNFELPERKKCGLITAVTISFFYKVYRKWLDIGFNTRFIPVSYVYSKETVAKIHKCIQDNTFFESERKIKKIRKRKIAIDKQVASFINIKANEIAEKQSKEEVKFRVQGGKTKRIHIEIYGFRLQKQLRKLSQSIALQSGDKEVKWSHIEELQGLLDYIRLPKYPKVI